jgi:hypothetical protein
MRGSFHLVMRPAKMSASTSPLSRTGCRTSGRLYATVTAPSTVGMCSIPGALDSSSSFMGASEAPKSTVPSVTWRIPPPEPMEP